MLITKLLSKLITSKSHLSFTDIRKQAMTFFFRSMLINEKTKIFNELLLNFNKEKKLIGVKRYLSSHKISQLAFITPFKGHDKSHLDWAKRNDYSVLLRQLLSHVRSLAAGHLENPILSKVRAGSNTTQLLLKRPSLLETDGFPTSAPNKQGLYFGKPSNLLNIVIIA